MNADQILMDLNKQVFVELMVFALNVRKSLRMVKLSPQIALLVISVLLTLLTEITVKLHRVPTELVRSMKSAILVGLVNVNLFIAILGTLAAQECAMMEHVNCAQAMTTALKKEHTMTRGILVMKAMEFAKSRPMMVYQVEVRQPWLLESSLTSCLF
jgi:hypothetical protein